LRYDAAIIALTVDFNDRPDLYFTVIRNMADSLKNCLLK